MSGLLQYKWICDGCGRGLRANFTRKDGRRSLATRIVVGATSVAISVHTAACVDQGHFATFCPECADDGLVGVIAANRKLLVPPTAQGAFLAEGDRKPPSASVPCRGCAAVFVSTGDRDDHEIRRHTGLKPNAELQLSKGGG